MAKVYLKFEAPKTDEPNTKDNPIQRVMMKAWVSILKKAIPKANPDFDDIIDEVQYWLIECDNVTGIPEREIGLNKEGEVVLKMPFKHNYGYWTDNNMRMDDFKKHFVLAEIGKESFEHYWDLFDK